VQRVATTVVALVGSAARRGVRTVAGAGNVRGVVADPALAPLDRAVEAWRQAQTAHIPYLVHDADPLQVVADAWARRFDQQGPLGELEVAVADTVARWRERSLELPDYYLVVDGEDLPTTLRHWYLGFLSRHAPARVVPVAPSKTALVDRIGHLGAGRWWPDLDRLLQGVERVVPNKA
jgi:hypothetical protein